MNKKYFIGIGVTAVAIAATAGGITASAASSGNGEESITGPEADQASQAALEVTGGGTVLEVEAADSEGATWEVEILNDAGEELEVLLDGQLNSLGVFPDDEDDDEHEDDDDDGEEDDDNEDEDGEDDEDELTGQQ